MTRLSDVASVIRSKNAGPYELTFDIIFKDRAWFEEAKRINLISAALISSLYGIAEEDVLDIIAFEPANAIKATIKRPLVSGAIGETDVYGAQQHVPLLSVTFGRK
ncbi:DUF4387 domain-containing protein [Rhizobium leguminosarum]|uniref:DUF4387 domain-containing protein n=1 Tax=Rhizobium leguminosarum TaxID=384 RepID=UPI0036D80C1C